MILLTAYDSFSPLVTVLNNVIYMCDKFVQIRQNGPLCDFYLCVQRFMHYKFMQYKFLQPVLDSYNSNK